MGDFSKRALYLINTFISAYIIFFFLFSSIYIYRQYSDLFEKHQNINKEYKNLIVKYKKTMHFILKNDLPKDINYFNSLFRIIYGLPSIVNYKIGTPINIITAIKDDKLSNGELVDVIECYNNICIKIFINKKNIFIRTPGVLEDGNAINYSLKKTTLIPLAINRYIKNNKNVILFSLLFLFIIYLFQSWKLLIKNKILTQKYKNLLFNVENDTLNTKKKTENYEKLQNTVSYMKELINKYFLHYITLLLTKEFVFEDIDMRDVFRDIEKFFTYELLKKDVRLILKGQSDILLIKSDPEILFVITLNLMYRSIFRAEISSEIIINMFQKQGVTTIELIDIGYVYRPKSDNTVRICELPDPILQDFYEKLNMSISVYRDDDSMRSTTSVSLRSSLLDNTNNVIKLNLLDKGKLNIN